MSSEPLAETTSLCPDCLERVPGRYDAGDDGVYLTRTCEEHGTARDRVWGSLDHWEWSGEFGPDPEHDPDEPLDEELAIDHDHACLAVVEVTDDCNLSCSYCFASSGPGGDHRPTDEVIGLLETVTEHGARPIQFSGGEPTVRDDLPALVERAREMGIEHVEVNTNGLRLVSEPGYAERLADAGVTAIYLQFDGLERETYREIREADLLDAKREVIDRCREVGLPVVLVPTVVPGVNDDEMGDIVRFALDNRDVVESVNFQPVAHFGRYGKNEGRFTLDDAARTLADQVEALEPRDLKPIPCCSSRCQFATALLPNDGSPIPVTRFVDEQLWHTVGEFVDESDHMDILAGTDAGREWACETADCCGGDASDGMLDLAEGAGGVFEAVMPVDVVGFMDADAADVDRLSNCCLSVPTPDGELVPFCGYNMTTTDGRYALRNRYEWGGRPAVDELAPEDGATTGPAHERVSADDEKVPVDAVPAADRSGESLAADGIGADATGDGTADSGGCCGPSGCCGGDGTDADSGGSEGNADGRKREELD